MLTRAAQTVATRRNQSVRDVLHARALDHYQEGLRQYLTLRAGSVAEGRRAFSELRAAVRSASPDVLSSAPGPRARLYRMARDIALALGSRDGVADLTAAASFPYRSAPQELTAPIMVLRALAAEQAEILELRHARELRPTELAHVLDVPVEVVLTRLEVAVAEAEARLERVRPLHTPLRELLLHAFALSLPSQRQDVAPVQTAGTVVSQAPALRPSIIDGKRSRASWVGRTIAGRYAIESKVGGGAFGDVFRAVDTEVRGHVVALKLLHEPCASDEERERALRELQLIASVFHPSIVQFKDHGWHEGRLWFVMPWYEGETLEARIDRGALSRQEARAIFEPLARALASMHARGIRHQDIKPENIFLADLPGESAPLPVLLDLGVAAEDAERIVAGTPTYFAPEVASQFAAESEKREVGHPADVFSLALSLRNALEPDTREDIPSGALEAFIERRAREIPEMPRNPKLRFLHGAFERWMAMDADERPSAAELADELALLSLPEVRRARRRRAVGVALPVMLGIALLIGIGAEHVRRRELARSLEIAEAEAAAAGLRDDLTTTRAEVEQLLGRIEAGAFSRRELQLSLAANSGRLREAESRVRSLTTRAEQLEAERERVLATVEARQRQIEALEARSDQQRARISTTEETLRQREAALRTTEATLDEARRDLRETRNLATERGASIESLRAQVEAEVARASTLRTRLEEAHQERARALGALEDARRELSRARRSVRPASSDSPDDAVPDASAPAPEPAPAEPEAAAPPPVSEPAA